MPILGLSDIVIFPGMVAPLLVETAQSTKLIDDVVGGDRLLGVVLQRNAEAENPLPHEMYEVGCAARVLKMLKFPDNTVRVLVEGLWRIRIKDYAKPTLICAPSSSCEGPEGGLGGADGHDAQRAEPVPGDHQAFAGALRADQDRGAQHRGPGALRGPDRGEPEPRAWRSGRSCSKPTSSRNG